MKENEIKQKKIEFEVVLLTRENENLLKEF
jgi:hypothetical protein